MTREGLASMGDAAPVVAPDGPTPAPSLRTGRVDSDTVYSSIRSALAEDGLAAGARLPSERALGERFGVSRLTLRRALSQLAEEGVLRSERGSGWYVVSSASDVAGGIVSLTAVARARGVAVTASVLAQRVRPASLGEADALSIVAGSDVFELERIRYLDGVLIGLLHSLVPAGLVPGLLEVDFRTASLFDVLRGAGIPPVQADYDVEARAAGERVASLLELARGQPILVASQTTYGPRRRTIETGTGRVPRGSLPLLRLAVGDVAASGVPGGGATGGCLRRRPRPRRPVDREATHQSAFLVRPVRSG